MIVMPFKDDEVDEEEGEQNDDEVTLPDDVLDEVGVDDEEDPADDTEGFGLIDENEEAAPEEEEDANDDEARLEDDAEEVEYDPFDDVDEM
jgi:hypothetical protein